MLVLLYLDIDRVIVVGLKLFPHRYEIFGHMGEGKGRYEGTEGRYWSHLVLMVGIRWGTGRRN